MTEREAILQRAARGLLPTVDELDILTPGDVDFAFALAVDASLGVAA